MANEFGAGTYKVPKNLNDGDASAEYSAVVKRQDDAAIDQRVRELLSGARDQTPSQPATPTEQQPQGEGTSGPSVSELSQQARLEQMSHQDTSDERTGGDIIDGVVSDLARGIPEIPRQAIGGVADAIGEMDQFIGEITGFGGLNFSKDGIKINSAEELQEQGGDIIQALFKTSDADTATGGFARSTAQFITGFLPAMKATKAIGLGAKGAGAASRIGQSLTAGAAADAVVFDPHEDRLSTYLNEFPALEPFVSDYLASNEEDAPAWEGRLKNAIEGAGLGITTDGVGALFRTLKYYKKQRANFRAENADANELTREAARDTIREAARKDLVQDVSDEDLRPLGDPDGPLIGLSEDNTSALEAFIRENGGDPGKEALDAVDRGLAAGAPPAESKIFINHARIQTEDDVKAVIQELADARAPQINEARGGEVVTNEETIKASSKEYQDIDDLLGRPPGPMTAAQAVAARDTLTASADQLVGLAERARDPKASKADVYNFRRAMSVHYALQSTVIAARTETARALQSWAIPSKATKARGEAINELIQQSGGSGGIQALADAVAKSGDNPVAIQSMARELGRGKYGKALYQVFINGILSGPKTHMVNILSNTVTNLYAIPERYTAGVLSKTFYDGEVDMSEAGHMAFGFVKGARDGLRLLYNGNRAEGMDGIGDVFDAFGKNEIHVSDISGDAFGATPGSKFGRGMDILGKVVGLPGAALGAEDKFFKSMGYRMELNARAARVAASEGLTGREAAERMADVLSNPPEDLVADALDFAHYQTFTNPLGQIGQKLQTGLNSYLPLRFVVPFVRTPTNIIKYTFARTPLAYMSGKIRAEIKAGGAQAAQAHARVALGSTLMMVAGDMAMEGTVTGRGPTDHKLRRTKMDTGWMPYSIKVGDRHFQYSRLDPIGMMMGLAADISEISTNTNEEQAEMIVTAGVLALANNLANKSYMTGIYDFIGAIDPSNPTNTPGKYITDFSTALVPYSSFLRNVGNAADPVARSTRDAVVSDDGSVDEVATFFEETLDKIRNTIPGLGKDLPPQRDLYGEVINRASGLGVGWDFLSPIASRADNPDPVTQVILDNQIPISNPPRVINGVKLDGEQYSEFQRLAGEPLKAYLDQLVKSPSFKALSDGPDGMKADTIRGAVANFRKIAKAQMLQQFPELQHLAVQRQMEKLELLKGTE